MWDYKSSRINFRVSKNEDGYLAEEGDVIKGYANCKIDGIAQNASTESAQTLIDAFYNNLLAFPYQDNITMTTVVIES